jgi:hypothetical protein
MSRKPRTLGWTGAGRRAGLLPWILALFALALACSVPASAAGAGGTVLQSVAKPQAHAPLRTSLPRGLGVPAGLQIDRPDLLDSEWRGDADPDGSEIANPVHYRTVRPLVAWRQVGRDGPRALTRLFEARGPPRRG